MKTLTKKQRREIYLEAALFFAEKTHWGGKSGFCDLGHSVDNFPEYLLFKPDVVPLFGCWFGCGTVENIGQEQRITAPLFAAEMCKP